MSDLDRIKDEMREDDRALRLRHPSAMLDAYQRAVAAYVVYARTPRWRRRLRASRRARAAQLAAVCDRERAKLGVKPGAVALLDLLDHDWQR